MSLSQAALAPDDTPQAVPLPLRRRAGFRRAAIVLIVVLVVAGLALTALHVRRAALKPVAVPQTLSPETANALTPPLTPPIAPPMTPVSLPDPLPALGADVAARLDAADERAVALAQRVDELAATLSELTTSLTILSDADAQLRSALDAVKQTPRAALRRSPRVKQPAPSKAAVPDVIAVDRWADQPSAAIREAGGRVAFYREGDLVGSARIERIDMRVGNVQLRLADGSTPMVTVRD